MNTHAPVRPVCSSQDPSVKQTVSSFKTTFLAIQFDRSGIDTHQHHFNGRCIA